MASSAASRRKNGMPSKLPQHDDHESIHPQVPLHQVAQKVVRTALCAAEATLVAGLTWWPPGLSHFTNTSTTDPVMTTRDQKPDEGEGSCFPGAPGLPQPQ